MRKFLVLNLFFASWLCANTQDYYGDIEALYWKPSHAPIIAGRQIGPSGGGLRFRENFIIKGDHDWGVRARFGYAGCGFFLDASYLYYDESNTSSFTAAPGSVIRMPSGAGSDNLQFLSSKLSWRYQNVDVRYGHHFLRDCRSTFYAYGNARWVKVEFSNLDTGIRTTPLVNPDTYLQKTDFNGGGLGVGVGGRYALCWGFGLGGSLGAMAVIGDLDPTIALFEADIGNSFLTVEENAATCVLPALELRFGLDWSKQCRCLKLGAEVGYELDTYFDLTRHNIGIDRDGADDVPQLTYFGTGFGGPYFRVSARY